MPALNVADASVWVSALVASEVHHASSRAWLGERDAAEQVVVAPDLLVPEVAAAIARRSGRPAHGHRAVAALLRLPNLRLVVLDAELAEQAGRIAADSKLRGTDAVYAAVAKRLGVPLVTWDREQLERGRGVVEVVRPS
jgi:predicted nucleic acid-binding protein